MSTFSGPFHVPEEPGWAYGYDFSMGHALDAAVFSIWGPCLYVEVRADQKLRELPALRGFPEALFRWIERWPETPPTPKVL